MIVEPDVYLFEPEIRLTRLLEMRSNVRGIVTKPVTERPKLKVME